MAVAPRSRSPGLLALDVSAINTQWMLRLRFGALFGQLATIAFVRFAMDIELPLAPLLFLIGAGLLSNIGALGILRRTSPSWLLPALMVWDVLHLTGMLYLTGGPMNPFSFMYLVQIALATVVLPPRVTWALSALSLAGSAVLFLWHRPLDLHGAAHATGTAAGHGHAMRIHLIGMWVAFSIAAAFIVYFLLRIRRALAQREAELEAARSLAARRDKLASLATLSAGAAHELATPLGTIAIAAQELERHLLAAGAAADRVALDDLQLIRSQVARCRGVLDQLAREAGDSTGESLVETSVDELLTAAQEGLSDVSLLRVDILPSAAPLMLRLPRRSFSQALRGLLRNALEASSYARPVRIQVTSDSLGLHIAISDEGTGMSAEILQRIGEPFFTTKAPGQGMGLGIFLTRAVVDSLGGQLHFFSLAGKGTRVTLTLPVKRTNKPAARTLAAAA